MCCRSGLNWATPRNSQHPISWRLGLAPFHCELVTSRHNPIMKYCHRVLGFLCLPATITYLDRVAISVPGPRIQESLHISPESGAGSSASFRFLSAALSNGSAVLGISNCRSTVDDWISVGPAESIDKIAAKYLKHLGRSSLFELY